MSSELYFNSKIDKDLNYLSQESFKQIFHFDDFILNSSDKFLTQFQNFNIIYFYTLILISLFFIISNLSFKLSAAPFHF